LLLLLLLLLLVHRFLRLSLGLLDFVQDVWFRKRPRRGEI